MKSWICLFLTLVLFTGMVAAPAKAEETTEATTVNRFCSYCLNWVDWEPWGEEAARVSSVEGGHYYLVEDIPNSYQKIAKGIVCIDLNGHTMSGANRILLASRAQLTNPDADDRPVINIFDTVGGGKIVVTGSTSPGGGVVTVSNGGQVNLYSGTLKCVSTDSSVTTAGGVVAIYTKTVFEPEFNMYGGVLDASECVLGDDSGNKISSCDDGCGGAVSLGNAGVANLMGGQIISGKANFDVGRGDCVYLSGNASKLSIGGSLVADDIYLDVASGTNFSVSGAFTGSAKLSFNPDITLENGMDIGDLVLNGSITGSTLTCATEGYFVDTAGTDLILTYADPNAEASVVDGSTVINYSTWEEAFAAANGRLVRLNKPIEEAFELAQDLYLDLNGCDITGKVTVAEGKTLYCMDSETDDFTVSDNIYGKLAEVDGDGTVKGLPLDSTIAEDAYFMITEEDGISFHRIGLQLTAMSLRAENAGVYYKSAFGGDEMVKELVASYGVALSVVAEPTKENMETDCKYSVFTDFAAGGNNPDTTSTLLKNIMKESNPSLINNRNAQIPIYGRAYLLLKDGTYLFGTSADRSLRQQVEKVNDIFDTLTSTQKENIYSMYKTYRTVMKGWSLTNILALKDPSKDNVLKILNISNSHGQDSVWLLPAVLKAEMPDQEILVVEMYMGFALTEHIEAAKANSAIYYYYTNSGDGWSLITTEMSIKDGLQSNNWDVVMFNESSRHLGLEKMMSKGMVDWFLDYLLTNLDYEPKMLYNMTWSNPTDLRFYSDSTRQKAPDRFQNTYTNDYGFDHVNHYNMLVEMTRKYLVGHEGFYKIIYNATPVQYAGEVKGVPQYDPNQVYDLYRDYTHLSDYARLIVAYNWYCQMFEIEKLTAIKVDVINWEDRAPYANRHQKLGDLTLTEEHVDTLIESVNHSLQYPLSITSEE